MARGLTLLELMIALVLLSLVVTVFYQLQIFTHQNVLIADRRSQVQNEVSFILEHMSQNIKNAIGNTALVGPSNQVVNVDTTSGAERLSVYIDASGDGARQDPTNNPAVDRDHWISYRRPADSNEIEFCGRCQTDSSCGSCMDTREVLGRRVTEFDPVYTVGNNFVDVTITARFDPSTPAGVSDNPQVSMQAGIAMLGVSTN